MRRDTADVKYGAAVGTGRHMLSKYLATEMSSLQIGRHDQIKIFLLDLEKWIRRIGAGAVDQDIASAQLLHRIVQQRLNGIF